MRYAVLIAVLALLAGINGTTADAQSVAAVPALPAGAQVLDVHAGGRVVKHSMPGGETAYEHQWPGVYFESRFTGQRVFLTFDDPVNEYRLLIDDLAPVTLNQPGSATLEVSGLSDTAHAVRLEKVTESIAHAETFNGFTIPADEKAMPVTARARQIEYIGDSSMAGYGDRSTTRTCSGEEVRATTDTQQDYTALTAKHFDADYQINAYSGRGMVRNYNGAEPDAVMPNIYPYSLFDKSVTYDDPTWQPQIIVIKLDADFATPVHAGEKWPTQQALADDYTQAYVAFATMLHQRDPDAAMLIWMPNIATLTKPDDIAAIKAEEALYSNAARQIGIVKFGFIPYPAQPVEDTGCDYHPNLLDQKNLATAMIDYLDGHPEFWGGR